MEEILGKADKEDSVHETRDEMKVAASRESSMDESKNPSSSDSESDEEAQDELQIENLEKLLQENPLNYETHVQYIQCTRKLGNIEKLRQARENLNKYYLLSPQLWQDWTKDEVTLYPVSENFERIEELYERGVREYLFVPLWCDYLEFVQEHDPLVSECSPAGVSKMRNLFERALTAAGLHVSEGNKIWEAYREFEQAVFLTIDGSCNEEKEKQAQRIRALFHRQLSVPLINMRSTLTDYKIWEAEQQNLNNVNEFEGVPTNIVSAYQKALELCDARVSYEEQLSNHDATEVDRLQYFMNYIKLEDSCCDPARVQILYERALTDFPWTTDLWAAYTRYLDNTLKISNIIRDVYSRATKSCTWVGELWINYMLALERMSASEKELSTVFERATQCSFPSFKEYLNLFLTRVDGLRRRISSTVTDDGLDYSLIRETFQRAVDYLSPELISIDDLLHLYAYWAHLEATLGKDLVAARGVWESLIKKSGSLLEVWQGYIAMEVRMGHIHEARSIYKRCYSKRFQGTGSEDICHSWLRFERQYGTLDDLDLAVKKVTPRLQELKVYRMQQDSKAYSLPTRKDNSVSAVRSQKRKSDRSDGDKQPRAKKRKDATVERSKASLAVSNSIPDIINNVQEVHGQEETLQGTGEHKTTVKEVEDSKSNKTKLIYTDKCTAFLSNLSPEANESHIREFFKDSGGVTAIRLLRDKVSGQPRGLAYVDFSDAEHLAAAISKNKQKLLGKKVSIARSDPKQGRSKPSSDNKSSHGHGKGHVGRRDQKGLGEGSAAVGVAATTVPPIEEGPHTEKPTRSVTFAMPRAVAKPLAKPLGWSRREAKFDEEPEELKSNDAFRQVLLKK